ncbi:hypothetical protein ASPWEDRAFT_47992 [Aspergillus wentii DTO 134E9]|uniref:Wax synthase domain-containing protein n=1 Tax=Aspergillus wentii DTO 134E9 TaxID=1073089 RepID=A0A1L9S2N9_ASPWE|nr:uncharacterized protein ASPWEDRAFT_47992 [Aspergillus wentii DTO 134E9]KAI9924449.1 hypothetical protein MW887_007076 [Aspergillus wentii]OJJ41406.1 hypothetical protein ASPWEDRAFT_47992 [Aspergillus wentii DTO 134E9]
MADPIPGSYREAIQNNQRRLEDLVEQGVIKPFFLWHLLIFISLPLVGLLVPCRAGSRYVRPAIFALVLSISTDIFKNRRVLLGANGYMIGLMTVWWTIWSATILIFHDAEKNFKRIERRSISTPEGTGKKQLNGEGNSRTLNHNDESSLSKVGVKRDNEPPTQEEALTWQGYPESLSHRLNWVMGLICNMRGPEWNWRISTIGPLPPSVKAQLGSEGSSCKEGHSAFPDARTQLRKAFATLLKSYLFLDLVKILMMRDPYFWLVVSPSPPPPFPFSYFAASSILVRLYRLALTGVGVYAALAYATAFNPIIFLGLSLAFPNASRALTSVPLDAPWLYAYPFGPFLTTILDEGLTGCWSRWWHQVFRFGFTSTGHWLVSFLPSKLARNPVVKRTIVVFTAFCLSGLIHGCGSYTQVVDTRPLSGPFLFFFLQAVGVTIQTTFITPMLPPNNTPLWLRRSVNAAFVFCWLFVSCPFVADDFARGGLWLTEPIPVSPLRGLGLGAEGEGWWCWKEPWFRSWSGGDGSWWQRGVRLL